MNAERLTSEGVPRWARNPDRVKTYNFSRREGVLVAPGNTGELCRCDKIGDVLREVGVYLRERQYTVAEITVRDTLAALGQPGYASETYLELVDRLVAERGGDAEEFAPEPQGQEGGA